MNDELKKALGQVEVLNYVEPGPVALQELNKHRTRRNFQLDKLKPTYDNFCAWCNEMPIPRSKRKYCSEDCQKSAMIYSNPQSPGTKAYLLITRQSCACAACGVSFEDELISRIQRTAQHYIRMQMKGYNYPDRVSYHAIGDNWGEHTQVDHIHPIFKGGDGIGLKNVQVLCYDCHLAKTIKERK